jgi:hypothetical protein
LRVAALPSSLWAIIDSVGRTIHAALWALLIAGTAFLLLQIPEMRRAGAIAEAQRLQEIAEENKLYCEKWGMPARTHEHVICTMDLGHIRQQIEQRIAQKSAY